MRNYSAMSNQQLAAFARQIRRSKLELACENGHIACGCSNVRSMDGNAACFVMVESEIAARKLIEGLKITPESLMAGIRNFHRELGFATPELVTDEEGNTYPKVTPELEKRVHDLIADGDSKKEST